jgi:hypothetical protein
MKKLQKFALLGVVALAGTVSMTSCSSNDDPAIGPDGERLSVKTDFLLNIPVKDGASTRMTDANAQVSNTSVTRTFGDLTLVPFGVTFSDGATVPTILGTTITKTLSSADATASYNNAANHYLFKNVTIPVGTKSFVGYLTTSGSGTDNQQGALVDDNGSDLDFADPANLTVNLKSIASETSSGILAALNAIAAASYSDTSTTPATVYKWSETQNPGLYDLFYRFTRLTCGSSAKAQAMVDDLTAALANNSDDLSNAIKAAITANPIPTTTFPANLPEGAIAISWADPEGDKVFEFVDANTSNEIGFSAIGRSDFANPAALVYRVNSPVATSTTSQADKYTGTTTDWANDILANYTAGNTVQPTTASVALTIPMEYAVARLEAEVALSAPTFTSTTTTFYYVADASGNLSIDETQTTTTTKDIDISSGFNLTGIIIGGQNPVKWDFTPKNSSKNWALYDGNISSGTIIPPTTAGGTDGTNATNSTLVLETAANIAVRVALELQNNTGADLKIYNTTGNQGKVIKKDSKFYLTATLDPTALTSTLTDGKVFKQDFVTKATFTITPADLNKATDVIPDLTKAEQELGLSVNLEWQTGDTYNVGID